MSHMCSCSGCGAMRKFVSGVSEYGHERVPTSGAPASAGKDGNARVAVLGAGRWADVKVALSGSRAGQTAGFWLKAIQIAPDLSRFWVYATEISRVSASYAGCTCGAGFEETLASDFPTATAADFAPLEGGAIDEALGAMGDFADLVSPFLLGHSAGVARLADLAGQLSGLDENETRALRRAALVHDLGRVTVPARVWEVRGRLSPDDWERVRLHAYHTERILSRSVFLSSLAQTAVLHHERLVGKVDAAADRKSSVLRVHAIHEDVKFTRAIAKAVRAELDELASWLGLEGIAT